MIAMGNTDILQIEVLSLTNNTLLFIRSLSNIFKGKGQHVFQLKLSMIPCPLSKFVIHGDLVSQKYLGQGPHE